MTYAGCFLLIVVLLYKDSLVQSARRLFGSSPAHTVRKKEQKNVIFASMRFHNGQPLPEAKFLQSELLKHDINLKIVELVGGDRISTTVFEGIEQAEAFLVFGTKDYGKDTGNPASTYFEAEYARNKYPKKILLLRMIQFNEEFEHPQARILFGMNDLSLGPWIPGNEMPPELVDEIKEALVKKRTTAAEP